MTQTSTTIQDFEAIVDRYEAPLLRYVGHLLGGSSDQVEDVVQETFLRLHTQRQRHGLESVRDHSVWLYRVAHNLAMDAGRKKTRHKRAQQRLIETAIDENDEDPSVDTIGKMARAEACERALAEVAKLPEGQRHVVMLKIIEGMTMKQIAEVTGISPSNVCYRLNNALQTLARRLRNENVI